MRTRTTRALAALAALTALTGCAQVVDVGYVLTVPIYKATFVPKADETINAHQARIDELRPLYEAKVAEFRADIAEHKQGTADAIAAQNLPDALSHLDALYALTHPCREQQCGTYPYSAFRSLKDQGFEAVNRYEAYIEREGIDTEDAFIRDAVEKIYPFIDAYIDKRDFDVADVALERYAQTVAGPPENAARYVAAHKKLKKAWVDVLVADAESIRGEHPGTAALLYAKASLLASQRGDADGAATLLAQASGLRARVMNERGFEVGLTRVSGPFSEDLASHVMERQYDGEVRPVRGDGARASLTIATRRPTYARSIGSTTSTFDYQDGTRTVKNPAYVSAASDLESARRTLADHTETCNSHTGNDPHVMCSSLDTDAAKVERAERALEGLPETIEEPIIKQYEYPVTLLHLDTTMAVGASIDLTGYRGSFRHGASEARLTDREHGAYSKNDGGVAADPGIPPSERAGDAAVVAQAQADLDAVVMKALEGYRGAIAAENQGAGGDLEVHDLATVVFLRPSAVPDDLRARLDAASKITGATDLLVGLK
jgi:hypothetical protein